MSKGMTVRWQKGTRTAVTGKDMKGRSIARTGKNGGPVIEQTVTKLFVPKAGK